jgi:subtilisin family serine protease
MKIITLVYLLSALGLAITHNLAQATVFQSDTNENQYSPDEIIVKFKPNVTLSARSQTSQSYRAQSMQSFPNDSDWSVAKLSAGQTVAQALSDYANDPNVEYAQPNYIYHTMQTPNDPDYGQLWAAKNTGQTITTGTYSGGVTGTSGDDMNLEAAWNVQTDCSSVIVAVVDSGVNYNSTDLTANMWNGGISAPSHGWNFVGTGSSDPMDYEGHGTHVAGIIGAMGNNYTGTTGVCWKANIMAVRVLDATGSGFTTNIIQGIDYAINNGAKIINMSLGGGANDPAMSAAVTRAQNANVLVVVAAGNQATNNDATPSYPCSFSQANLLCVAALDQKYALATFSNWGTSSVDIGAPGTNIRSTWAGSRTTTDDPLTSSSGWTSNSGWNYLLDSIGNGVIANPVSASKPYWGINHYNANTDDRIYKSFNFGGADVATLSVVAAVNVKNGDFFTVKLKAGVSDPFISGTQIYSVSGKADKNFYKTNIDSDISSCLNTTCSFGFQLKSALGSTADIGVLIHFFSLQTLTLNNTSLNTIDGTSMATPEVAGVAALVWSHNPQFTYTDVVNAIKQGGRSIPALTGKTTTGKAVDALGALTYIAPPTGITVKVQ